MTGQCLCGEVGYGIHGRIVAMYQCHCSRCRRASGSSFATNLAVEASGFEILRGADALSAFEQPAGTIRHFCSRCGSPVYSRSDPMGDLVYVRAGTLDGDPRVRPEVHLHVASKAAWDVIADDLPTRQAEEDIAF